MSKELKKPKKDKTRKWCIGGNVTLAYKHSADKDNPKGWGFQNRSKIKPKYIRCHVCDQRFEVYNTESCCDGIIQRIPPHKAY